MKRWCTKIGEDVDHPELDAFISDIIAVCEKHGLWLGHEDSHGGFEIVSESTKEWLQQASDSRK